MLNSEHFSTGTCTLKVRTMFGIGLVGLLSCVVSGTISGEIDPFGDIGEYVNRIIKEKDASFDNAIKTLNQALLNQNKRFETKITEMQAFMDRREMAFNEEVRNLKRDNDQSYSREVDERKLLERKLEQLKVSLDQKQTSFLSEIERLKRMTGECVKRQSVVGNMAAVSGEMEQASDETNAEFKQSDGPTPAGLSDIKPLAKFNHSSIETPSNNLKPSFKEYNMPTIQQAYKTRRQVEVQADNRVAFYAYLTGVLTDLGHNQDIAFDHVVTNIGSAYNANHGTFVASVTGTYAFSTTLRVVAIHKTYGHFVVNGHVVAKFDIEADFQVSQHIIVHLTAGDDVAVQNTDVGGGITGNGGYSTFSGYLLYPDSGTIVIG